MKDLYNQEGDPGKCEYLHNPNWTPKLFSANLGNPETLRRKNFCGACHRMASAGSESERQHFSNPALHEEDERCTLWRIKQSAADEVPAWFRGIYKDYLQTDEGRRRYPNGMEGL